MMQGDYPVVSRLWQILVGQQIELPLQARQGGAQLVRRIGQESALRLSRVIDHRQQRVQGDGDGLQLDWQVVLRHWLQDVQLRASISRLSRSRGRSPAPTTK